MIEIKREIRQELFASAASYPVVTVIGARQSGKTTAEKKNVKSYLVYSGTHQQQVHNCQVLNYKNMTQIE